jgi:hypothetical protein
MTEGDHVTDTTTARPIPTDMATLRSHYLPAQPASTVTEAAEGVRRIDELARASRARLAEYDRQAKQRAAALAAAAVAGDDLDAANLTLVEPGRDLLTAAIDQLRRARAIATHRLSAAERTDPVHLGWLADCRRIVDEWELTRWGEDTTAALLDFMQRHNPR